MNQEPEEPCDCPTCSREAKTCCDPAADRCPADGHLHQWSWLAIDCEAWTAADDRPLSAIVAMNHGAGLSLAIAARALAGVCLDCAGAIHGEANPKRVSLIVAVDLSRRLADGRPVGAAMVRAITPSNCTTRPATEEERSEVLIAHAAKQAAEAERKRQRHAKTQASAPDAMPEGEL